MLVCVRGLLLILALVVVSSELSGCADIRKTLGYDKVAPDEFLVVARAPLALPAVFVLPPPTPGLQRPQELTPSGKACQTLTGHSLPRSGNSASSVDMVQSRTQAFLRLFNVARTANEIRSTVDREAKAVLLRQHTVIDHIFFWRNPVLDGGPVIDAEKELYYLMNKQKHVLPH